MATAVDKAAETGGEVVAHAAEAVAEEAQNVATSARTIDSRMVGLFLGGTSLGVAIGAGVGYFILSKKLNAKYERIADEEIAGMKAHYDSKLLALENREEKAQLESVKKDIQLRTEEGADGGGVIPYHTMYRGGSEPDKIGAEGEDIVAERIFDKDVSEDPEIQMADAWDIAAEQALRAENPGVPYVIHRNEHEEGPEGSVEYDRYTLTYFEGDDVLCRDDDQIIEKQDEVVGLGNLSRFGHGSGDPNIVYVRNEQLKCDFEIVHSDGRYATEVAGFQEDELQHSSMRRRSPRRSEIDADN